MFTVLYCCLCTSVEFIVSTYLLLVLYYLLFLMFMFVLRSLSVLIMFRHFHTIFFLENRGCTRNNYIVDRFRSSSTMLTNLFYPVNIFYNFYNFYQFFLRKLFKYFKIYFNNGILTLNLKTLELRSVYTYPQNRNISVDVFCPFNL